jgi:hypothetical protein
MISALLAVLLAVAVSVCVVRNLYLLSLVCGAVALRAPVGMPLTPLGV